MAYATITDLTAYLGIDESTADDALLSQLLTRAQAAIDGMCNRTFEVSAATVRYYDWRAVDGYMLHVDADLCAITSVVNGDGVTIAGTEYTTEPRNVTPWHALRLRSTSEYAWDGITGDIAITGKWAYSLTAPEDVKHVMVRLAALYYRQKDNAAAVPPTETEAEILQSIEHRIRRDV